jgi:hypothetical protein
MLVKTSELIDSSLDWAVAKCKNFLLPEMTFSLYVWFGKYGPRYSTDWTQGGPIIDQESITLMFDEDDQTYSAYVSQFRQRGMSNRTRWRNGKTPLIAAMRCFVASKLGDEVEIPDELLKV